MNGALGIVGLVLGVLGLVDLVFVFAACRLSGRLSRAEECGEQPRAE